MKSNRMYLAIRSNGDARVYVDAVELLPETSLQVCSICPFFEWGYNGDGPYQLAVAILLNSHDMWTAMQYYVRFAEAFLVNADYDGFCIMETQIRDWLNEIPPVQMLGNWESPL